MDSETGQDTEVCGVGGLDEPECSTQPDKKISDDIRAIAKGLPPHYRGLFLRAMALKASPRQAIKAKCQECNGYEDVGNRVRDCGVTRCPLHAYRPYQSKEEQETEQ